MCKKFLTLALTISVCMLVGCGGDAEEQSEDTGKSSDTPAPSKYEKYEKAADAGIQAQTRAAALLKQVKDADSAKAVAPMIKEASDKWRKAMNDLDTLMKAAPEAEQKEIDGHLEKEFGTRLDAAIKDFNAQVERIKAAPDLSKIIMPALSGE